MTNFMKTYSQLQQEHFRLGGVLLHPTSLPSGRLDEDAFRWVDFMAASGLHVWQVLPLGVPQHNLSPYQCYSAFAMNPALLARDAEIFDQHKQDSDFKNWYQKEHYWLDDYALFMVLKQEHSNCAWYEWPDYHKYRDAASLEKFRQNNLTEIFEIYWQQYQLYSRWREICDYASEHKIYLYGDMPLFVAHDSADVWANQECFLLDENGMPTVVAGVPPDYFSETGQHWGNPHYNWEKMQETGFDWWIKRLKNDLQLFDILRIDHFRGLEAVWMIDAAYDTAENGYWQKVPGDQLLQTLQEELGNVPLVAEDLGIITPEVNALRKRFHLPGMSVLQFSFDGFEDNPHKPQNIEYDRVVYTGTHDNDTSVGWFKSLDQETQHFVLKLLNLEETGDDMDQNVDVVVDALINTAFGTKGQLAVIPLQDFLHLDGDARMNLPGTADNNWRWRFDWKQIPDDLASDIRQKLLLAGRLLD